MANGTDSSDILASKVRPRLKREFEFAFRSHSEISGSLGRTRSRRSQPEAASPPNGRARGSSNKKKLKANGSGEGVTDENVRTLEVKAVSVGEEVEAAREEEAKSDVVELGSGDEEEKVGLIESVPLLGGEIKNEPGKEVEDEYLQRDAAATTTNDECGPMSNSIVKGDLEEKNNLENAANGSMPISTDDKEMATIKVLESNSGSEVKDDRTNAYEEGNVSLSAMDGVQEGKCDSEVKGDTKNVLEDGSLRSTASVINGGVVLEATPILVKGGNSKVGERPLRRFTRSLLKQNTESTIEDSLAVGSPSSAKSIALMKHMKVDASKKFPSKLKDLLDSGILEGIKVKYLRGTKTRGHREAGLDGVIKGSGIQCFCRVCKGNQVVTPALFELHAGSANKRPPEYIYLENRNTLRDVMNVCKDASLDTLDESLRLAIGCSSLERSAFCLNCRGSNAVVNFGKSVVLCCQCVGMEESQAGMQVTADTYKGTPKSKPSPAPFPMSSVSTPVPVPKSSVSTAIPVPKSSVSTKLSDGALKACSSQSKSHGRLTRKDLRMHKLVFEEDVLPDGTEVAYYSRGQKLLVGYKKGFGIFCSCCNSEVSPSQFEAHAGWASRRKPYLHIYTSNGVSLHELALSLSKNRKFTTHENDDLCQICRDGGSLICCDVCPRSYHKECLSLPKIPAGKWYCKFCVNNFQKEKFVERNANAIAAGRVAGVDPIEQITRRCIRIVKTLDADFGGCVLCRGHDFDKQFGLRTVLLCDQCEKEFHVGCLKDHNMEDLKELPQGKWFCCTDCKRIHSVLQKLVLHGEEKIPDSCVGAMKGKHEGTSSETGGSIDVRWRLLNDKIDTSGDTSALLSEALSIFHERFNPIVVAGTSGKDEHDLIPSMVFGDNFKGQELGGMYCAVLLVNQVVVSCAIIRFFGQELAELPLVATASKAEGKGYFQALFTCLEKLLGFLNIKNLVLPAAEEAESIWRNKFGFSKLTHDEFMKFRKNYQMMVFQGTSMLQKSVPKCRRVVRPEGG